MELLTDPVAIQARTERTILTNPSHGKCRLCNFATCPGGIGRPASWYWWYLASLIHLQSNKTPHLQKRKVIPQENKTIRLSWYQVRRSKHQVKDMWWLLSNLPRQSHWKRMKDGRSPENSEHTLVDPCSPRYCVQQQQHSLHQCYVLICHVWPGCLCNVLTQLESAQSV